jgi:hypothetical protein
MSTLFQRAAATIACVALVTGCSQEVAESRKDTVQTGTRDEVTKTVADYARRTHQAIGSTEPLKNGDITPSPCEGQNGELADSHGPYSMVGSYQAVIPQDKQLAAAERIRDDWKRQGYEIKEFRRFRDGQAVEVIGRNPADGYEIALTSTAPPTAFRLAVFSPCFREPSSGPTS